MGAYEVAALANEIQDCPSEETRLGNPNIVHEEALQGLVARDAPCFRQSIGAAAALGIDLVEAMWSPIHRRVLATDARHSLTPVHDPGLKQREEQVDRDP